MRRSRIRSKTDVGRRVAARVWALNLETCPFRLVVVQRARPDVVDAQLSPAAKQDQSILREIDHHVRGC